MPAPDPNFTRFAATGDAEAFRALVEEHLPMVQAVAWRRLGENAHLAADVSQAVFTRLARVARGLPLNLILAAWLHRQAVRLAIDTVRSETRRRLRESTAAAMLQSSRDDDPDSPAPPPAWQRIAPLLDEAMDRLPEADRAALVLRFLEDRDFAAVGSALKTSPEAARKRVARSLEKLRALLSRRSVALPSAAVLAACLAQNHAQAQAHFLTAAAGTASASAAKLSAAAISKTALTAATSTTGAAASTAVLTTFFMSHLTSAGVGAALILIAAGFFHQHQEVEINRRLSTAAVPVSPPALSAASRKEALPGRPGSGFSGQAAEENGPGTLAEIINALETITTGPDDPLASLRIALLLRKVPPAQYLEFYLTAENRLPPPRWRTVVWRSISEWSPVDPGALCMALFDSDSAKKDLLRESKVRSSLALNSLILEARTEGGMTLRRMYPEPFREWLRRDLPAAVRWVQKNAATPMLRFRMDMFQNKALSADLLEMAAGQLSPGASADTLRTLAGVSPNPDLHRSWAAGQLKEGRPFEEAITQAGGPLEVRALSTQLALKDPDALRSWVRGAPADSPAKFDAALGLVGAPALESVSGSSMRTLEGAEYRDRAAFALEHSGAVPRSEALREIAGAWVRASPEGMKELRDWVNKSGPPGETQSALETAARLLSQNWRKLPEAMAFAADVADPARRDSLLRGMFLRWRDTDPTAAAKFLTTAPPPAAAVLEAVIPAEQP